MGEEPESLTRFPAVMFEQPRAISLQAPMPQPGSGERLSGGLRPWGAVWPVLKQLCDFSWGHPNIWAPTHWEKARAPSPTFWGTAAGGQRGAAGRRPGFVRICKGFMASASPTRNPQPLLPTSSPLLGQEETTTGCLTPHLPATQTPERGGNFNSAAALAMPAAVPAQLVFISRGFGDRQVPRIPLASNYAPLHPSCSLRRGCQLTAKHGQQALPAAGEF